MDKDLFDQELFSEEEAEALKIDPSKSDEMETTSPEEEKVETEVASPPTEKKPTEEPKPEEEAKPPSEPPAEEKPPSIDGILTKDGKNFIPFKVLEEERAKRQQLETELEELKKPKPEERKPAPPAKEEVVPTKAEVATKVALDIKAMAKNLADKTYASPEEAEEAFGTLLQTVADLVEGVKSEAKETASSMARTATIQSKFEEKVLAMKAQNPWIQGDVEDHLVMKAAKLISERKVAPDDLEGMVKAAEDAVAEGKKLFRVEEPKIDIEAERKKARDQGKAEALKEIQAKFNLKEMPTTLSDVTNVNPDVISKFDELDKLLGFEFEEAYGQLTPEEQEAYRKRVP